MDMKTKKSFLVATGGAAGALLLAGAYLLGSVHPLHVASAAGSGQDFQVIDKNPPLSKSLGLQPFGSQSNWVSFQEMQQMQKQMDEMFNQAFGRFNNSALSSPPFGPLTAIPDMDLQENDKEIVVRLDMPGIDKTSIKVEVQDNTLSIGGTRVEEQHQNGGALLRSERHTGSFQRSMTLPGPVHPSSLKTDYENGVLTIRIEKPK